MGQHEPPVSSKLSVRSRLSLLFYVFTVWPTINILREGLILLGFCKEFLNESLIVFKPLPYKESDNKTKGGGGS